MTGADEADQAVELARGMTQIMPVGMFVTDMLPDGRRRFVFGSNRLLHMHEGIAKL